MTKPNSWWLLSPMVFFPYPLHGFTDSQNLSQSSLPSLVGADASFQNLQGRNLEGCSFQGADFTGALLEKSRLNRGNLKGTQFPNAQLAGAQLVAIATDPLTSFRGAHLVGARFGGPAPNLGPLTVLHYVDFSGANLSDADFSHTDASFANFSHANLRGTRFTGAYLSGANFSYAQVSGGWAGIFATTAASAAMDLSHGTFKGVVFKSLAHGSLDGADLRAATIHHMPQARAQGALLSYATLQGADLTGTDFGGAQLQGANLRGTNLTGTRWAGAWVGGADVTGAFIWEDGKKIPVTFPQVVAWTQEDLGA